MEDNLNYLWTERVAGVWGHFAPELLSVSIAVAIGVGFRPLTGPFAVTVPVALMAFVVATWLMMRRHDRRLCEQCAASMPLNAAEQASRYRRRFWMAHAASERRFLIPYLVVLLGSNFIATSSVGRMVWALVQSSMIYLIMSHSAHRRLQPWCPTCRKGGGGSKDEHDSPRPVLPDHRQPA